MCVCVFVCVFSFIRTNPLTAGGIILLFMHGCPVVSPAAESPASLRLGRFSTVGTAEVSLSLWSLESIIVFIS